MLLPRRKNDTSVKIFMTMLFMHHVLCMLLLLYFGFVSDGTGRGNYWLQTGVVQMAINLPILTREDLLKSVRTHSNGLILICMLTLLCGI